MPSKKIWAVIISVLIVVGAVGWVVYEFKSGTEATKISAEKAEVLVNDAFDAMAVSDVAKDIARQNSIKVNSLSYGNEKNVILDCTVSTVDAYSVIAPNYEDFMGTSDTKMGGTFPKSSTDFLIEFEGKLNKYMEIAPAVTYECSIELYDTENGFVVYAKDEVIDAVYGGFAKMNNEVSAMKTYTDSEGNEKEIKSKNINKGFLECIALRYEKGKPDTATGIVKLWNGLKKDFDNNFIKHDRWKTIFKGLWVTIKLTLFSLLIGIVIGFLVAFVRCTYLKNTKRNILLKIFNAISQVYLTVIRGTPAMVQIMIMYFVIFMPMGVDKFIAAVICFGLNSGAYVAEIVRGGIMSVDEGQTEAGRSLGFGYMQTMFYIVFPQAFKAVLPALANEFVVLLKETSIAFYIGLGDLMYAVNAIRAATYAPFMPLIAAALIYFIMVLGLSKLVSILERRLRNNER